MKTPKCFENAHQWREYQKLWRQSKDSTVVNYCVDCTPEYKCAMVKEGRCAYPRTMFRIKDEELVGVRDKEDLPAKTRGWVVAGVVIR